jgi:hypothetical protein
MVTLERFLKKSVVFFLGCATISVMNSMIDPQDPLRDQIQVQPEEAFVGWPGDGSGEDDLADMNANEADDYRNEDDNYCE